MVVNIGHDLKESEQNDRDQSRDVKNFGSRFAAGSSVLLKGSDRLQIVLLRPRFWFFASAVIMVLLLFIQVQAAVQFPELLTNTQHMIFRRRTQDSFESWNDSKSSSFAFKLNTLNAKMGPVGVVGSGSSFSPVRKKHLDSADVAEQDACGRRWPEHPSLIPD